uniref:Uncharacterized protein n=1 Tax=Anguilla anguilla TaxID=7936 RepID=A0A0E9XX14_ANGAN
MSPQLVLKSQVQIFKNGGRYSLTIPQSTQGHTLSESFLVSVHRRSNTADLN